jgi:dienelactone hydrolase
LPDVSDGRAGHIAYASAIPFELHHILRKLDAAAPQPMVGWLLVPESPPERMACVVCCHGSLGWRGHHHEHMVQLLEMGIAVFRAHSFEARNVASVVEDQMAVTHAMLLTDAYRALQLLARHPRVDADRIGIMGWSLGGTVSLYAAWEPLAEVLAPEGERFAAHLPLYPAAHLRPEEPRWTGGPIRVLHGADTTIRRCASSRSWPTSCGRTVSKSTSAPTRAPTTPSIRWSPRPGSPMGSAWERAPPPSTATATCSSPAAVASATC